MDTRDATCCRGLSTRVLTKSGEVMPAATAVDVSASGYAPARGAGRYHALAPGMAPTPKASAMLVLNLGVVLREILLGTTCLTWTPSA